MTRHAGLEAHRWNRESARLLSVVFAVRDLLALLEHVFFGLLVGNTGWRRWLPAILGIVVRVLVVGVLVLGITVDAGCHGCEFRVPLPGTQPAARAGTWYSMTL